MLSPQISLSSNPRDIIERATGYKDSNLWLDWVAQTAREQQIGDCVACSAARPQLYTEPAPMMNFAVDPWGYQCMLGLTQSVGGPHDNCSYQASLFPPIANDTKPGLFTPHKGAGNYTFTLTDVGDTKNSKCQYGEVPWNWCEVAVGKELIGPWARPGLFFYCGGHELHVSLKTKNGKTSGSLGNDRNRLVRPALSSAGALTARHRRHVLAKRSTNPFYPTADSPTYIYAIGDTEGFTQWIQIGRPNCGRV